MTDTNAFGIPEKKVKPRSIRMAKPKLGSNPNVPPNSEMQNAQQQAMQTYERQQGL